MSLFQTQGTVHGLPVTVYGTTHAHLVHMCWPLLWGLHQMGCSFATCGTYTLVGSIKWIMRVLNSEGCGGCITQVASPVFCLLASVEGTTVCVEIPLQSPPPPGGETVTWRPSSPSPPPPTETVAHCGGRLQGGAGTRKERCQLVCNPGGSLAAPGDNLAAVAPEFHLTPQLHLGCGVVPDLPMPYPEPCQLFSVSAALSPAPLARQKLL